MSPERSKIVVLSWRRAEIYNGPPRYPGLRSWSLLATERGKVFICDMRGLLGEVVGCFEVAAREPDLAVYIPLEKGRRRDRESEARFAAQMGNDGS
jgi:hypothetical protein